MKRKITEKIQHADRDLNIRTFIIWGMKCTGKTYSVLDYIKGNYEEYLYIDCGSEIYSELKSINGNLTEKISSYFRIDSEYLVNIPLIIDEPDISGTSAGLFDGYDGRLKLFIIVSDKKDAEEVALKISDSKLFRMTPMDFGEFLTAQDKEWYDEIINGHVMSKRKLPEMIHSELLDMFSLYRVTGGMPDIIEEYIKTGGTENIRRKQEFTSRALIYDSMSEFDDGKSSGRIESVFDAVQNILEKDNHKFMYSVIRDGALKSNYIPIIDYLCSRELIRKVERLGDPASFRLYFGDFCMLKGVLKEKNLESVLIQNVQSSGCDICYWESGQGATLDMVIISDKGEIPVEIKAEGKSNLRSVKAFLKNKGAENYFSLSEDNFSFKDNMTGIPYYASYAVNRLLS